MSGIQYCLVLGQETDPMRESGLSKVARLIRVKENQPRPLDLNPVFLKCMWRNRNPVN